MKINKIEEMATKIACAEITNGDRNYWLYDVADHKLDMLAKVSVQLAQKIVDEAEKVIPTENINEAGRG